MDLPILPVSKVKPAIFEFTCSVKYTDRSETTKSKDAKISVTQSELSFSCGRKHIRMSTQSMRLVKCSDNKALISNGESSLLIVFKDRDVARAVQVYFSILPIKTKKHALCDVAIGGGQVYGKEIRMDVELWIYRIAENGVPVIASHKQCKASEMSSKYLNQMREGGIRVVKNKDKAIYIKLIHVKMVPVGPLVMKLRKLEEQVSVMDRVIKKKKMEMSLRALMKVYNEQEKRIAINEFQPADEIAPSKIDTYQKRLSMEIVLKVNNPLTDTREIESIASDFDTVAQMFVAKKSFSSVEIARILDSVV